MGQGTDRDDEHLNIFLEFVPGGSIASLLTKFGKPCTTRREHVLLTCRLCGPSQYATDVGACWSVRQGMQDLGLP